MLTSDFKWEEFLTDFDKIFTLEEHFVNGGLGSMLRDKVNRQIIKFGIKNEYIHKIGNRDYLREYYKIDGNNIAQQIKDIING